MLLLVLRYLHQSESLVSQSCPVDEAYFYRSTILQNHLWFPPYLNSLFNWPYGNRTNLLVKEIYHLCFYNSISVSTCYVMSHLSNYLLCYIFTIFYIIPQLLMSSSCIVYCLLSHVGYVRVAPIWRAQRRNLYLRISSLFFEKVRWNKTCLVSKCTYSYALCWHL